MFQSFQELDEVSFSWIMKEGRAVMEVSYLYPHELEYGRWHRSRDIKDGDFPFGSFMINKKWWLEEELNNVLLQFQQVCLRKGQEKQGWKSSSCE